MGTRLLTEHLIKQHNPNLRYVRVRTSGMNRADIYAWNEDLHLSAEEQARLERFAGSYLLAHVCFHVKAYSDLRSDQVPVRDNIPELVAEAAMRKGLDQYGIVRVVNGMLPSGNIAFSRYELTTGTIYFDMENETAMTEIEKELLQRYLQELIPLGATCRVNYC
ncbi:hypothetical protein FHS18_004398 [Paenibacillus phyllosphaerae]|uniref:Uncharacterized protein n=1 Tax=Paenibacillus phyllosphaerae TaxID=274593 RepID=A0A7W5B0U6_9BACL|nr:hypothetical protein [Paenibacillus phyllosphaerae]MBB3112312.1 hypothetical protein [Paenibacillus phyllosphaerae]